MNKTSLSVRTPGYQTPKRSHLRRFEETQTDWTNLLLCLPRSSQGRRRLAGQTCDVTARDHSGEDGAKNPTGVQIKSNVDKVGDVTITAIQAGHKTLNDEDERSKNNAVRIAADIPLSDVNADLTGSVDYDLVSKNANVRIGYHKDDITVKLRTLIKQDGGDKRTAESTINLDYSGLEGIGVGVEVKDNKEGHLQVTKDDFKLKVPIKDNRWRPTTRPSPTTGPSTCSD